MTDLMTLAWVQTKLAWHSPDTTPILLVYSP